MKVNGVQFFPKRVVIVHLMTVSVCGRFVNYVAVFVLLHEFGFPIFRILVVFGLRDNLRGFYAERAVYRVHVMEGKVGAYHESDEK